MTKILEINPDNLYFYENDIKYAAEIIKSGGLVAFPTETVYGLGGDATNPKAAEAIFAAKGRPSDNPLIIHVANPRDAEAYAHTGELYYKLAERFMPGPLTVIMNARESVPLETRGGLSTVAVRCPSNQVARMLIEESGVPIAAPSANISGSPSPTSAKHVIDDLYGKIDVIIDGGDSAFGVESTIVKIEDDSTLTLLRPGSITVDELLCIADVKIADAVTDKLPEGAVALSPGMKYRHYAPKATLVLLDGDYQDIVAYIKQEGLDNTAIITYSDDYDDFCGEFSDSDVYVLGARDNSREQAHHLFSVLRKVDKHNYTKIYAPLPDKSGVGLALYNRMIRAAAHQVIDLRQGRDG
ncbi:MAG: threonylcarbamoyl-AMP synthase [Ruminococcaceae bacterium]|nr:threonylcarbamoyl-AMP synthase [Oscillospiraceae bacterium]